MTAAHTGYLLSGPFRCLRTRSLRFGPAECVSGRALVLRRACQIFSRREDPGVGRCNAVFGMGHEPRLYPACLPRFVRSPYSGESSTVRPDFTRVRTPFSGPRDWRCNLTAQRLEPSFYHLDLLMSNNPRENVRSFLLLSGRTYAEAPLPAQRPVR